MQYPKYDCFRVITLIIFTISMVSCKQEKDIPKPIGYFRIDLPERNYELFNDDCPYTFELPNYAIAFNKPNTPPEKCMKNIFFPRFNATIYITYIPLENNFYEASKFSQDIVYEHRTMASGIKEQEYIDYDKKVYGNAYTLEGDVACNFLFYLTDSTNHYFAGSMYFETKPNYDSLQPVIDFLREDVMHLIETFHWK
jgi:gliding motility-associated lipoprotein GldD